MNKQLPLFPACDVLGCKGEPAGRIAGQPFCQRHLDIIEAQGRKTVRAR